jgi:exopolysaccharide biosynthesis polyprenyl glycosylphosphotransferase
MVAFGAAREAALVDMLRTCDRLDVEVFIVPRLFELHNTTRDSDDVWGIPLMRVRRAAFRSRWWEVKRAIDVAASVAALLALAPLLAVCALGVRVEGGPGVIFKQSRVGLDGRPFQVLKFRSLKPVDEGESRTQWNIAHDKRLGPFGRFLRKSSLDELPQLWNILRGDMSLVGPRPERPHFVDEFSTHIPRYMARHRVPAGLTGWAQVHGLRGDTSIEDRARFDNYYIENWSFWLDVKIILRTVSQVLRRQGG